MFRLPQFIPAPTAVGAGYSCGRNNKNHPIGAQYHSQQSASVRVKPACRSLGAGRSALVRVLPEAKTPFVKGALLPEVGVGLALYAGSCLPHIDTFLPSAMSPRTHALLGFICGILLLDRKFLSRSSTHFDC
jgi:hypothetical protein